MKKIILSTLAAFAMLSASAENSLAIAPVKVEAGATTKIALNLTNDFSIFSVYFDLELPAGFHFVQKTNRGVSSWAKDVTTFLCEAENERAEGCFDVVHNGQVTVGATESLRFAGSGQYDILGNEGKLMDIAIKVDAGVEPGVYPIVARNVELYDEAVHGVVLETYTSYIVVGEPTEKTLALKGNVPSFVNEALASETAISNLDLSAVTAINGGFTYVDKRNVVAPADVTASVKYEGDKTGYYSVNVPFAGAVTGKVYKLTSTTAEYAHFDPVTEVEAGKTYLAEGAVAIAANAKVASVAEQTNQTGNYVLNDTFYHGSNLTVPATRGLFEGASLSNLRVVVDGVLTNINVAQIEAAENAYDLQGRQATNAKNGVFVVNGKKQFVK